MREYLYQKYNITLGWMVFAISLIIYTLTLEPTVSFWDCGEFISTASKLQVGHPPGAPLYQMLGAFFSIFSGSDTNIAYMMNFMSGLASAFTILFMFWTSTSLIKRIVTKDDNLTNSKAIAILGSAFVGSLTYTFSDSFWFNAVEAEVYAVSSFLMALLFWLGLKWEKSFGKSDSDKWIILISFIVGLSFGVHILSLLVIPVIVFIYMNKRQGQEKYTVKRFILTNFIAIGILICIFKFLFPSILYFFGVSELFFVNTLRMPFHSGSIIAAITIIVGFYLGLSYSQREKKYAMNTVLLCLLFMMIGFSCWLVLPIRANAHTSINENDPSSARELLAYYNREQYGDSNIFYDSYYSEKYNRTSALDKNGHPILEDEKPKYEKDKKNKKYIIVNRYKNAKEKINDKHKGILPRMVNPDCEANYKIIANIPKDSREKPTMVQNLKFMFKYQFGYMYFRYLFWNFIGKQNDIQGDMHPSNGNWITGFDTIDSYFITSQRDLPSDSLNNKGRNVYYGIPFILGIIGLIYQYKKDKKNFYNLFLFFLFTGFAIIFYTNPKPFEPRERDYAIVGSFYIFAIWISFGVFALISEINKLKKSKYSSIIAVSIFFVISPLFMAFQNWDDHDRSGRYTTLSNAKSYLDSCDKNAILFTIGDNDTFPLWYLQEVENYRTDIKIINSSLLATDWYIDQMKRKTYQADPIPSQLNREHYKYGSLDIAYHSESLDIRWNLDDFMKWIASFDERTFIEIRDGVFEKFYPTNKLRLKIDKNQVLKNGIVKAKDSALILDHIDFDIDNRGLTKNRILMLDILANNHWKYPIYFTGGSHLESEYIWMKDYLQLDGLAYQLVPIKTQTKYGILEMGRIDTDKLYDRIKKWDFGHHDKDFYLDPESRKNSISYRNNIFRLVEKLILEKKWNKAEEMLDLSFDKLKIQDYQQYSICLAFPEQYYLIKKPEKARMAADILIKIFQEHLIYYAQFDIETLKYFSNDVITKIKSYQTIVNDINKHDTDEAYKEKIDRDFFDYLKHFDADFLEKYFELYLKS